MFAALLCLPVLLMLTSVCLARPLRSSASSQSCRSGQQPMPDLNTLLLRSSPRVFATGRLIKGLYYSETPKGLNVMAAFYMACDQLLEQKPFLMMDFRSRRFFLDRNQDGCIDATGTLALAEIDPADFLPAVDGAEDLCNEALISQRQLKTWSLPHNGATGKMRVVCSERLKMAVRPEGADHQWRRIPPRELSIDLVADERSGRATGRAGAS